ncbi:MAG: hypothetical protein EPN22_05850 [Nitrospirae bacterium]|nr:MAG: hypothetical protein EPN22_05850 [Nitrospirota bacterium]
MKKLFLILSATVFVLVFVFSGCKKVEERVEKRVEQVKDARETANEMNKKIAESQQKAKEAAGTEEKK